MVPGVGFEPASPRQVGVAALRETQRCDPRLLGLVKNSTQPTGSPVPWNWCLELVSSQPLRVFSAALSPDQLPRLVVVNWRGRGESNSFRRSGAPALNQSTTSAEFFREAIGAPLSSADLPVSQTPVLQTGGRRRTRTVEEGEGVEPSTVRSARFSGPVACRHAPPSELVVPARLERATPAVGERCSAPLSYGTESANQRPSRITHSPRHPEVPASSRAIASRL